MGRKAKYTPEQKVQACVNYLSGQKSARQKAKCYRIRRDVCYNEKDFIDYLNDHIFLT